MKHLILFARAPALGRVKRRLAAGIGDAAAWRFHVAGLRHAGALGRERRWRAALALTPDGARHRALPALPRLSQGRGDLGARMAKAFRALPPGPAVLIGSDIPGVTPRHIARAFALLGRHDAVLGPASDGGYWLIGLARRRARAVAFGKVRWSTAHALADTRAALPRAWSVALADMLDDVDDRAAYGRWRCNPRLT